MSKIIGFIVTGGHLDIEWYQPMRSYRFWTIEALEDLKKLNENPGDFVNYYLDGQFFPLKEYLEVIPEDEKIMREMIQKGLLSIGPFYTQFDEWLPSAESMIRNCLYGDRNCRKFGGYTKAGYLPDNFGHPLQLPQILKGFGIDSLLFTRGMPEVEGGHPDEFIYKGIDGSEIFASHFREGYNGAFDLTNKDINPVQPCSVPYYDDYLSYDYHHEMANHDVPERIAANMIHNVMRIVSRYPSRIVPLIASADHMPPQMNIGDSVKAANGMQDEIEFVMGDIEEYIALAKENMKDPAEYSMELTGSKYQYVLLGALSTRTYLKRENFACEALLEHYAEPLDAIASLYGYPHKPALLDEAWEDMMINSAHDSIHGSSVDEVHVEMQVRYNNVKQIASGVIHDAMNFCGKQMKPWALEPEEKEVLVFAPYEGKQPVELWLPVNKTPVTWLDGKVIKDDQVEYRNIGIQDADGKIIPSQVVEREAPEVNGMGKRRNNLFPDAVYQKVLFYDNLKANSFGKYKMVLTDQNTGTSLFGDDSYIENEWIRVDVCNSLITLLDKRSGHKIYNLNLIEEDEEAGDAWDHSPSWIPGEVVRSTQFDFTGRLKELGKVRATLEIKGVMFVPKDMSGDNRSHEHIDLPVTFEISLYTDTPRADVKMIFDNKAKDHRLRLRIPSGIKTDFVRSQNHFAIIDRSIERPKEIEPWVQPPTQLLPCREWISVDNGKHGLAVALKGLYDYEAVTNHLNGEADIYITLLRGFDVMGRLNTIQREGRASMAHYTPGAQCLGRQIAEWSYIPYTVTSENKALFLLDVQHFLYPAAGHMMRISHESGTVESMDGLFRIDQENIQFSAFKKCCDGGGYILRVYENQGKETVASIHLSDCFKNVYITDLNEKTLQKAELKDHQVQIKIGAYKIVTLKLV